MMARQQAANDNEPNAGTACKPVTFISMFSGIEAASVAFGPLGWRALAFAEIEKFPSAVLAHHYPDVPNVGDMTAHDWAQYRGKVDVVCGGPPCFTAGHLVLSERGYVPIETIGVGDKVVTHKGRLRTVIRIGNERTEVGRLSAVGMLEPITCTPDHPFLSVKWRNQNTRRNNRYVKVEHCGEPEWVAASEMPGRQWCQLTSHANDNRAPLSAKFDPKVAMYVAGMYLGDGWIRKHEGKAKKSVILGINPNKYQKLKAVIGDAIHTVSQERTTVRVSIHDTVLADWLEGEFAHYSHLKTVPSWVMGHEFKADFLRGFLDADGSVGERGKVSISTTSRSVAYGISDLLATEGYVSSVAFVSTPDICVIEGRTCNQKDYYQVRAYPVHITRKARVRHGMTLRSVTAFEPAGEDTVFNIEVEDDNSYIVQGAVVHNCQAFSVAGLRLSMQDARGNLSLAYMRALHAIKPRNAITENVPGWLNTPDNAFGCFLAGLVGADDALRSPDGTKWPDAGMVAGPLGRAAWRILDAQYFGLAQRRRRVVVVADFGNGADPAAVLFERKGMFGNPAARREAGKDVAGTVAGGARGGGIPEVAGTMKACAGKSGGFSNSADHAAAGYMVPVKFAPEIARCDATREGSSQDYETTTMVAVGVTGEVAHTLKAEGHDASEDGSGRRAPIIAFDTTQITSSSNYSNPKPGDPCHPLAAGAHAPAIAFNSRQDPVHSDDCAQPLGAKDNSNGLLVQSAVRRLTPRECERLQGFQWPCSPAYPGAWRDDAGRWWSPDYTRIPVRHYKVRRITRTRPADMWEADPNGGWWLMAADGPRYKALGNSWAVPKFRWVGERITRLLPANDNAAHREAA